MTQCWGVFVVKGASLGLFSQPPIWHVQIIILSSHFVVGVRRGGGAHLEPVTSRAKEPCSCTWLPPLSRAPSAVRSPGEDPPPGCETPISIHPSQVAIAAASLLGTGYQVRAQTSQATGHWLLHKLCDRANCVSEFPWIPLVTLEFSILSFLHIFFP